MNPDVEMYLCPSCGAQLIFVNAVEREDDGVCEKEFVCRSCKVHYPVRGGIPRFVPAENYAGSFGYQWNMHRKTQLDSYTGLAVSRQRLFSVSGWSEHLREERILEAGSGAGRFTEVLLQTGADIFSFDYSNAVEANLSNNGGMAKLHLFQGDIFNIPFPQASFDKVICLGVLQHTPDPEGAFASLARQVKSGGELVIDIYKASFLSWLQWKYLLRPLTKRMNKETLYKSVTFAVSVLLPFTRLMRRLFGRAGARLSPMVEYTHLGLAPEINKAWAVLDTFDMYSPAHDHPQSLKTVNKWFAEAGFVDTVVQYGQNGITGRGKKSVRTGNGGN